MENDGLRWVTNHKNGDTATVVEENDTSTVTRNQLDNHGIRIGTEVTVKDWDSNDGSWFCSPSGTWVHEDCLDFEPGITDEEVAAAIASIGTAVTPKVDPLQEVIRAAKEEAYDEGWDARNVAGSRDGNYNPYRKA